MANISKVVEREKLKARRDPYWGKLMAGCYLGYRKMTATGDGNWSARYLDEGQTPAKQVYKTLGDFSELPNGERHDAAKKAALAWFEHLGKGGAVEAITVGQACDRLVTWYRDAGREKAAIDAEGRFRRWVHSNKKFSNTPLLKLTAPMLAEWRTKLAKTPAMHQDKSVVSDKPRAASSLNREMAVLKTALNLALEDDYVTDDRAWASKLKPIKDATGRRDCYLDADQRRKLITNATPDLAILIRAMSLIPLRPGALAALTVGNFDKRLGVLVIGKDKAGKDRKIKLPESTTAFFAEQAKDKLPAAPLFSRTNGKAWNKDSWKYPFKDAVIAAKLPASATGYALRHSTITDLISIHGLDILTVAVLSGTSIAMIEKHYGHLRHDHAANALASLAL